MMSKRSEFRVVIFSSDTPARISRLVRRIHREVPGARVCGVLCEYRRPKPLAGRVARAFRRLGAASFIHEAMIRVARAGWQAAASLASLVLAATHADRPTAPAPVDLAAFTRAEGCALLITADFHCPEALAFVRELAPDLGLVYATRILKRSLFAIPRHGSINIHKRKVPDYRGGGPVGLWELLDGQAEIGVTVHQVTEELDAGHVVNATTIPIEPFDTLMSLALKAHVVGNDLLVRSVAQFADGSVRMRPQAGPGRMFRNPDPQQLSRYERVLARRPDRYRPGRSRPVLKLLVKTVVGLPVAAVRNWAWRLRGCRSVTVLYHHVVADRPHRMGISTEHFLKHVQFLRTHYQIVSLGTAIEMLRENRVTAPTVVLTFDDGYRDNFLTLRAIVEETGVPITMFVSTEHMSSQRAFAHDTERGLHGFPPLTWAQLRQMHAEGFEIGSHTRTHFECDSRDRARLADEIVGSRRDLERELGMVIEFFSFPRGLPSKISPEAARLAADTYRYVFSAFGGTNVPSPTGALKHLKRAFHASHLWDLELQIQGVLEPEPAFTFEGEVTPESAPPVHGALLPVDGGVGKS